MFRPGHFKGDRAASLLQTKPMPWHSCKRQRSCQNQFNLVTGQKVTEMDESQLVAPSCLVMYGSAANFTLLQIDFFQFLGVLMISIMKSGSCIRNYFLDIFVCSQQEPHIKKKRDTVYRAKRGVVSVNMTQLDNYIGYSGLLNMQGIRVINVSHLLGKFL